jgi:tRNA A37 N6-isopentenylltransferase MiaA
VKNIIKKFPDFRQYNASKAIGYQEIITHIQNQKSPLDINKIKQRTRQYAKRQLT